MSIIGDMSSCGSGSWGTFLRAIGKGDFSCLPRGFRRSPH